MEAHPGHVEKVTQCAKRRRLASLEIARTSATQRRRWQRKDGQTQDGEKRMARHRMERRRWTDTGGYHIGTMDRQEDILSYAFPFLYLSLRILSYS